MSFHRNYTYICTMNKHISFTSIGQFRAVVAEVKTKATYIGRDENGDAIFDESLPKPKITFKGTVKLHGRNCGVNYLNGKIWPQSKETLLDITSDNIGFAKFVEDRKQVWTDLIYNLCESHNIDIRTNIVTVFMEYVGRVTQKGVAISELDKSVFIFPDARVTPLDNLNTYWIPTKIN
jgi:hypothetical protein